MIFIFLMACKRTAHEIYKKSMHNIVFMCTKSLPLDGNYLEYSHKINEFKQIVNDTFQFLHTINILSTPDEQKIIQLYFHATLWNTPQQSIRILVLEQDMSAFISNLWKLKIFLMTSPWNWLHCIIYSQTNELLGKGQTSHWHQTKQLTLKSAVWNGEWYKSLTHDTESNEVQVQHWMIINLHCLTCG